MTSATQRRQKIKNRNLLALLSIAIGALMLLMYILWLPTNPVSEGVVEGAHYTQLTNEPIVDEKAIMFFWYGCSHCLKTHEAMEQASLKADLDQRQTRLTRYPMGGNPVWDLHARLYYELERVGLSDDGHHQVMQLIQSSRANRESDIPDVLSRVFRDEIKRNPEFKSPDIEVVMRGMNSQQTQRKLDKGNELASIIGIQGVPSFLINGTQRIQLGNGVGYIDVPKIITSLITLQEGGN